MTIAEIINKLAPIAKVQFLHECLVGVLKPSRRSKVWPSSAVTFATDSLTPTEVLYWTDIHRPPPRYVGIVLWVPFEEYEKLAGTPEVTK